MIRTLLRSLAPARFTIGSYVPGERVVLQRNPSYWLKDDEGNGLPYLDEIVRVIVPDFEAELESFLSGESDSYGVLGRRPGAARAAAGRAELHDTQARPRLWDHLPWVQHEPGGGGDRPALRGPVKLEWFRNTQFRQAVAHSIDKESIIGDVQHGEGYPQWSSVSPAAGDFHNPDVRRYEYDLDRANAILDGLDWTDTDGDGIREDGNGNAIRFKLVTNTSNSVRERVGEIVAQGMTDIGLKVDFELIEFGELVSQLTSSYDWEAMIVGFSGGTDPYSGINFWHSSEALHLWHPNQAQPATEWEAEIDDLYVRGSQELDHDRRVGYYHRAQEVAAENVPVILHDAVGASVRNAQRLRQSHADPVRAVGHTLPVPHGPLRYPERRATFC